LRRKALREPQTVAQGFSMTLDAQRRHFSELHDCASQSTEDPERKRRASLDKGMHKDSHSGAASRPALEQGLKNFAVQRNESWEIVGLLMDVFVAHAVAIRTTPPHDTQTDLSPKLARALLYLVQHGGAEITVGSLADGLGVSLGWASRVADELVSIGFLQRIRGSRDRRIVQLQLNERAREAANQLWAAREGAVTAALKESSPAERQAIVHFLRRFIVELDLQGTKAGTRRG
jgi:DNA-binding MarR family transcriptional regulator